MAKIKEIIDIMEQLAPVCTQDSYDNSGFQVGDIEGETDKILVALDLSDGVIDRAIRERAQLIITHHPLIFHPLRQLTENDYESRLAIKLIEENIALYSLHTPLDACLGGVNDRLCEILGLTDVMGIYPQSEYNGKTVFAGRVGNLSPVSLEKLGVLVKEKLNAPHVRLSDAGKHVYKKIAICGGAGSELTDDVIKSGAEVFITGELKYHNMLKLKSAGIAAIEAGHYHTEYPVISVIIRHLQNALNELQYKVTVLDSGLTDPYSLENY